MNQGVQLHKFVNAKFTFANWEIDVFLIVMGFTGAGLILATSFLQTIFLIITGIYIATQYQKIKDSSVKGFFHHLAYYYGIRTYPTLPPSNIKFYYG